MPPGHTCHEKIIQNFSASKIRDSILTVSQKINESYKNIQSIDIETNKIHNPSRLSNLKDRQNQCKSLSNGPELATNSILDNLNTECLIHCIKYFGIAGYTLIDDLFDDLNNPKSLIPLAKARKEEFVFALFYLRITWWLIYSHTKSQNLESFEDCLNLLNIFEENLLYPSTLPFEQYKRSAPAIIPFIISKSASHNSSTNKDFKKKQEKQENKIRNHLSSRQLEDDLLDGLKDLDIGIITPITCLLKKKWNYQAVEKYTEAWRFYLKRSTK